jgi:hypothetical protein
MLISRCAWHRRYHGYTKLLGISSWKGLQVSFTDGICHKCAARVRADHLRFRVDRTSSARREHAWMPGLAALTLGLVVALVLIARPTHELPPLPPVVALLPPPAPVERALVEPPDTPAAAVAEAPAVTARRASAQRSGIRHVQTSRRPILLEAGRHAWSEPSALARRAIPVTWVPYRGPAIREVVQSP